MTVKYIKFIPIIRSIGRQNYDTHKFTLNGTIKLTSEWNLLTSKAPSSAAHRRPDGLLTRNAAAPSSSSITVTIISQLIQLLIEKIHNTTGRLHIA